MSGQFWSAVFWVFVLTLAVTITASLTRTKFINKFKAVATLIILVVAVVEAYPHVIAVWGSLEKSWISKTFSYLATVFLFLWTTVFAFGGTMMASQTINRQGAIAIEVDSLLYHFLRRFCGLDFSERSNLCNLSWLAILAILASSMVIFLIYGTISLISLGAMLIYGAN
ncbi:MAG TPA: hypothetical protein VJK26_00250, partial [Patescibacteria group bacterium]|nr:hypothetical protein [Patescibacteria group bacterium]